MPWKSLIDQKLNGFESVSFDQTNNALLAFVADQQTRDEVIGASKLLTMLCQSHKLVCEEVYDTFDRLVRIETGSRTVLVSALKAQLPHAAGEANWMNKALQLWADRGLFARSSIDIEGNSGPKSSLLVLSVTAFENVWSITEIWNKYWEPIQARLRREHKQKLEDFYNQEPWIAAESFRVYIDSLSNYRQEFKYEKGDLVPTHVCVYLQGLTNEPDSKVTRLSSRVIIRTEPLVCTHCKLNSGTKNYLIDSAAVERLRKAKGTIFELATLSKEVAS